MRKAYVRRPVAIIGAGVVAGLAAVGVIAGYDDPWKARVAAAGYRPKTARIGEVDWSYAEGPDNGPSLLLLHAQHMEWFSYSRVLPALTERFHVIAVDYPGHGKTVVPQRYPMTGQRIGADLAAFIESTFGGPGVCQRKFLWRTAGHLAGREPPGSGPGGLTGGPSPVLRGISAHQDDDRRPVVHHLHRGGPARRR